MVTRSRPGSAGALAVPGAVVLAAGLAIGAAALATWALAVVVIVLQVALAWAWGRALRASPGTVALIAVWALLGDLGLLLTDGHPFHAIVGVGGTGVAAVIVYQLGLRRAVTLRAPAADMVRPATSATSGGAGVPSSERVSAELVTALSGIVLGLLLTGYLALRAGQGAEQPADLMTIAGLLGAGIVVAVARLVGWAGLPAALAGPVGVAVAVAAGAGLGALGPGGLSVVAGLTAAAAGAVTAGLVDLVLVRASEGQASGDQASGDQVGGDLAGHERLARSDGVVRVGGSAAAAVAGAFVATVVPLACAAPLVYLVGRHLPG